MKSPKLEELGWFKELRVSKNARAQRPWSMAGIRVVHAKIEERIYESRRMAVITAQWREVTLHSTLVSSGGLLSFLFAMLSSSIIS